MLRQRESSPIAQDRTMAMSPTSKRRSDFSVKHIQSGVMGRARSTLNTLGDVWKPKATNSPTTSVKSASTTATPAGATNKTLDFLSVWSRQKKMPNTSKKKSESTDENVNNKQNCTDTTPIPIKNKEPKNILVDNSNIKENKSKEKRHNQKPYSRNASLDMDLLAHENINDFEIPLSRSYDDADLDLNKLILRRRKSSSTDSYVFKNDMTKLPQEKNEDRSNKSKSTKFDRKSKIEINNNITYDVETESAGVIKARLKLSKFPMHENETTNKVPKAGILFRHNSIESPTTKSNSLERNISKTIYENFGEQQLDTDDGLHLKCALRPRKKLSFKEPIVAPKCLDHKSDTLPKATKFLREYEEKRSGSLDFELESQAMRIVRTVGQAFEVCHKFNLQKNSLDHNNDDHSDTPCELSDRCSDHISDDDEPKKDPLPVTPEPPIKRPNQLDILPVSNYSFRKTSSENDDKSPCGPLSTNKEMLQMREQLEQQTLQTRQALGQLMLVREQLISETNARIEAQARTQQLLQQNRELLEHLASLGGYNESDRPGLTSATIGLAPQSQLPMLLSDPNDSGSPKRKTFIQQPQSPSNNNNNMSTINQQLNNLGSINQQLNTLTQQLSGLNQQSQNLQNFQNLGGNNFNQLLPMSPVSLMPNISNNNNINNNSINNNNSLSNQDILQQQDLFQSNQELLNRLQNLSLGFSNNNSINNYSPQNSFMYTNPSQQQSQHLNTNNNLNMNLLSSPSSLGNLTPSPILNRSSYSGSPSFLLDDNLGLSMERNLDRMSSNNNNNNDVQFIRPLSQVSTLTTIDLDGKVKVVVPMSASSSDVNHESQMGGGSMKKTDKRVTLPDYVTLSVTDESGNVTNTRKLSATPSFITRSTSEKVPNRSQMMSEVQRTTWARHTTK